jgi:hypothetical protein
VGDEVISIADQPLSVSLQQFARALHSVNITDKQSESVLSGTNSKLQ